ncbi:hypothetical protein [Paenibacillus sp. BC26]|uniref:hypothetical protein n=1 Tax=Paenibacillus sp. BC26 TaxID=1881032 RepID=UPI0008F1AA70|nr:hypothetical protein [Paenibacillus sp. BC26]SFT19262.1 hypothetical protein SAMN05428962_5017 [Paenibacillus sp. BC26]
MKYRYDPPAGSYEQQSQGGGQGQGLHHGRQQSPFPGISDPFQGLNTNKSVGLGKTPVPFSSSEFSTGVPSITIQPAAGQQIIPLPESDGNLPAMIEAGKIDVKPDAKADAKSGFNLATSLNDLKGVVDRLGGIDGIVTTMGKVQKVVGSITQMAPLIKVLASSFGKKGASVTSTDDDDDAPPKRRKKKRRRTGSKSGVTPGGPRRRRPRR